MRILILIITVILSVVFGTPSKQVESTEATEVTTATSAASASVAKRFTDVEEDAWYYSTVTDMAEKGILSGYSDGSFKPDGTITSAEFTSVIARIMGLAKATAQNSHWAGGYMQAALDSGWYDWDENPPTAEKYDDPIQRQLAVKILIKAMDNDPQYDYNTETAKISDFSKLNGRYYDTTLAAYADGIVSGDSSGCFNPESSLTRAEACTIIKRAMDKYQIGSVAQSTESENVASATISGGISANGRLSVKGTQIVNKDGQPVVLRGMSSHGLQWYPGFVSEDYIKAVADRGANVMRFAMYTEENGYIQNSSVKNTLTTGVDTALRNDMYAIIDWHILSDGNPKTHINEAKSFFKEMAERYKDKDGVIYEICNEPNGSISWSGDVKPYAEELISLIHSIDSDAIILVGTPQWCQELDSVVNDRINADNIMYTCHFYAGTHTQWLRDRITNALNNGIPIFISEWGTSDASGNGGVFTQESKTWLEYMESKGLSWCNWSLCDKNETSAALNGNVNPTDGISDSELSESGKLVFGYFK
jgi:aryl-phospho-beta-D-glucosidase BglC (GH1 family)